MVHYSINSDTIVALATAQGIGAIAVIRLSGKEAINITSSVFSKQTQTTFNLNEEKSHTIHLGLIKDKDVVLDEVLVSLFKAPHSYTGENVVEISCHGSVFIQQQLLQFLVSKGCRMAQPGEFTLRGYLNGKFDLSQAEAVADLIASNSGTSHQVAIQHMRGGFSEKIKVLREHLLNFASLIELELDFSEEDVEFANRADFKKLVITIQTILIKLIYSFELGNVIKNGISVAIVGKPNAGKSTLLNALLNEERAIVSEIPGTTRDTIEDSINIDGILFRFIDTAGLRDTNDTIEALGVKRTMEKIKAASIIIYLFDVNEMSRKELELVKAEIEKEKLKEAELLFIGNKIDTDDGGYIIREFEGMKEVLFIAAKTKYNVDVLERKLISVFDHKSQNMPETIVTNARHVDALNSALHALENVMNGLNAQLTTDILALEIKNALYQLGLITGEVTNDDILGNIFSKFCIGK